jgi:RecA-family ATPase
MRTAWRVDGTLREFPKFPAVNVWFEYPVHRADETSVLKDIDPEETWQKNFPKRKSDEERKQERSESIETAFSSAVNQNGEAEIKAIMEYLGVSENTVRNRLKEHGGFWISDGKCGFKASSASSKLVI